MVIIKRSFWVLLGLLITMTIAACGSNGSTSTGSGRYGGGSTSASPTATTAASTPTTSGTTPALIKTATATVKGQSVTILTNAQGMTLYYRTSDSGTSVCSGGCASAWPPLLVTGSASPTSATSLPGKLTVFMDANGEQVEYNGHPLYTYSGDSGPGQINGEGVAGVWFVATTTLAAGGAYRY